jgi:hypothetical protein
MTELDSKILNINEPFFTYHKGYITNAEWMSLAEHKRKLIEFAGFMYNTATNYVLEDLNDQDLDALWETSSA